MSLMAKHSRIFWIEPKDDDVRRLNQAVLNVQEWMKGLVPAARAVELAAKIAEAVHGEDLDGDLANAIERAIVESGSDAFVRDGNELQITVVALAAAVDLVRKGSSTDHGWGAIDAFAAATWSALSFQKPVAKEGLEVLRLELLQASNERTKEVAEQSRNRSQVPEVGLLSISDATPTNARSKVAFKTAVEPLVKALRENAELDREEIDFLWWRLADWSERLDKPISEFTEIKRAVVAGLECGAKLKRVPSSGHRNVVLKGISSTETFSLLEVVAEIESEAQQLTADFDRGILISAASVFPLLAALAGEQATVYGADVARSTRDWGSRALLEAGVLHLSCREG